MQSPYKMDHDLAGGENATFSFNADTVGGFTYYCRYDLPSDRPLGSTALGQTKL